MQMQPKLLRHGGGVRRDLHPPPFPFNVVKLDSRSRVSFLRYQDFRAPFPELQAALSCDLAHRTARSAIYSNRSNPPILHRKELLLPRDCPLVGPSERLTRHLEDLDAFADSAHIGTRDRWAKRLSGLGLRLNGSRIVAA